MDKLELKQLIIELKENGHTFQDISDILKSEYGITKTRQSIHGLYSRATTTSNSNNKDKLTNDILRYRALGLSYEEISNVVEDITDYKIRKTIDENNEAIEDIKREQERIIARAMADSEYTYQSLKEYVRYNKIDIKDSRMKQIIATVLQSELESIIQEKCAEITKLTDDSSIAKSIASKMNIKLTDKYTEKIEKLQRVDYERAIEHVDKFKDLKPNWNGYEAPEIDRGAIENAKELLKELGEHLPDNITPTARQSIQFEYKNKNDSYLELEIYNDYIELYIEDIELEKKTNNKAEIKEEIIKFLKC